MSALIYRTRPNYRVVPFERLSAERRERLHELTLDPDFFGVLEPLAGDRGPSIPVKKEAALLLYALREPGPLPRHAQLHGHQTCPDEIKQLVLDGVLEVAAGEGFVSGPRALALLGEAEESVHCGAIATLSEKALVYAERLEIDDPRQLATRLYAYHRLPLNETWRSRLPDAGAVMELLHHHRKRTSPTVGWQVREGEANDAWIFYDRRHAPAGRRSQPIFKLYLSPAMAVLGEALAELFEVLDTCPAKRLKIGTNATHLLRPDKIVVYFHHREILLEAATKLAERLTGAPVHGVPFSAEIAGEGLLSWGLDPPSGARPSSWRTGESWRSWLTRRLAIALVTARRQPAKDLPPRHFARARLQLEGVDTDRWLPRGRLVQEDGV